LLTLDYFEHADGGDQIAGLGFLAAGELDRGRRFVLPR
jgi:hypothetical protein